MNPIVYSAAVADGTTDNSPVMQGELNTLSASGGGILVPPAGTVYLGSATTISHTGYGNVKALLHVPNNVQLWNQAATEGTKFLCEDTILTTGDCFFHVYSAGGGRVQHDVLKNLFVSSVTPTPAAFSTDSVPPAAPWAVFLGRGHLTDCWFEGNLRACVASVADHNYVKRCFFGGYASIEFPTNYVTIGDNKYEECQFASSFCSFLLPAVTGTNRAIIGWTFIRNHFGSGQCIIYCPTSVSGQYLVYNAHFYACSIESPGRGIVYDSLQNGAVNDMQFYGGDTNTYFYATSYPTDGPMPYAAVFTCGQLNRLKVRDMQIFLAAAFDPSFGGAIDVVSATDCELGDCAPALDQCIAEGIPFAKVSGLARNVVGIYQSGGVPPLLSALFRIVKTTGSVQKGDVLEWQAQSTGDTARDYQTTNSPVVGIAAQSLPSSGAVPAFYTKGPIPVSVNRTGRGTLVSSTNLSTLPTVSGSDVLVASLNLGSGGAPPKLVESIVVGQTSIKATAGMTPLTAGGMLPLATLAVRSTMGWPPSGTAVVNAQTITYTGTTATQLTGCTGGTGAVTTGMIVSSLGDLPTSGLISIGSQVISYTGLSIAATTDVLTFTGIPATGSGSVTAGAGVGAAILRVCQLTTSNAGFSASGACKVGSTYFLYGSKVGTTYLAGVSSMVTAATILASGGTVTEVNKIPLNGQADGFKQTNGSAVFQSGPFDTFTYGAALYSKSATGTTPGVTSLVDVAGSGTSTNNPGAYVTGGTRLNGGITGGATTITVFDTTGFPSTGSLIIAGSTVTYTGTTGTTFTGCAGAPTASSGAPVCPKPGTVVTGGQKYVRVRYGTVTQTGDQAVAMVGSSWADANGPPVGFAQGADAGPIVTTYLTLPG